MFYVIVQKKDNVVLLVGTQVFRSFEQADIERIYLQPNYNNPLEVKQII